jgi:hypothetical protein
MSFWLGLARALECRVRVLRPSWPKHIVLTFFTVPFIAVQVVLDAKDMPSGNAVAFFFNSLGGALSISIAQNIFSNGLKSNLPIDAPGVDPTLVINAGATHIRETVTAAQLPGVLLAYMSALAQSFVISIAVGGIATIFACFVEWKNVKGKKIGPPAA